MMFVLNRQRSIYFCQNKWFKRNANNVKQFFDFLRVEIFEQNFFKCLVDSRRYAIDIFEQIIFRVFCQLIQFEKNERYSKINVIFNLIQLNEN